MVKVPMLLMIAKLPKIIGSGLTEGFEQAILVARTTEDGPVTSSVTPLHQC